VKRLVLLALLVCPQIEAAAVWQASGTLLGSTGADITPVIPAHATNDILILVASSRFVSETLLTPSGWTLTHGPIDNTSWRTYFFYKRAASGAETNPLLDWSGALGEKYGQVHTIRGAITTGDPYETGATALADLTDPIVVTGTTTQVASQLVIVAGIGSDNASASMTSVTSTDPATYTQRHFSTIATGADATGWFFTAIRATAGATGNVTNDFVSTMPAGAALVAAIKEPAAAATCAQSIALMGVGCR
jgi:hypothetical protein